MRRTLAAFAARTLCAVAVSVLALLPLQPVLAATRQVSMGNYYFEDDETKDRARLAVMQGDQITFTIRQTAAPPHSVNVDELGIHSGDMPLLFDTYTTPPLERPGSYRLYCQTHQDRGHVTVLSVQAAAQATQPPAQTQGPGASGAPQRTQVPGAPTPAAAPNASPQQAPVATPSAVTGAEPASATVPVGRGRAPESDRRVAAPDPNSLEALTGRALEPAPWTRALRLMVLALIPIAGAAALAIRRSTRPRPAAASPPGRRDVIAISRSLGAGGEEIGRRVASCLGLRFVDEEIVLKAADLAGVDPADVRRAERAPPLVARVLESIRAAPVGGSSAEGLLPPAQVRYRHLITEAIGAVADEGGVVIVAHAASVALAGRPGLLRVLVTAPPEVRRARLVEAGLTGRQADRAVRESDRERRDYLRRFYDVDEELPTHYDLVVNTDVLPVDVAVAQIVGAAQHTTPTFARSDGRLG